ncbi:MAG: DUF2280 domain-containing protein [Methylovirgula sp.]|uniref:DUF2280 domain-containing protein n=1 Tax=Methylovirgula sp. TaxID=1978224 RepID=UPI00307669BD
MASAPKLTNEVRAFVVQSLAMFDSPNTVAESVKKEFGIEITRQSIEHYNPTSRQGHDLAKKWADLFEATRKEFLDDTKAIAISHRSVRIRALQRMAAKAEEMGGLYTNRRELTGRSGGPIETVSTQMTAKEAADAYAATLDGTG